MDSKETCAFLKDIRRIIAELNGISFEPRDCDYEGECSGTCAQCEAEEKYLEEALEKRRQEGMPIYLHCTYSSGRCQIFDIHGEVTPPSFASEEEEAEWNGL